MINAPSQLWAGALSLLLIHDETGCLHSAGQAARLLEQLADDAELTRDLRDLCERASQRLRTPGTERRHVCQA